MVLHPLRRLRAGERRGERHPQHRRRRAQQRRLVRPHQERRAPAPQPLAQPVETLGQRGALRQRGRRVRLEPVVVLVVDGDHLIGRGLRRRLVRPGHLLLAQIIRRTQPRTIRLRLVQRGRPRRRHLHRAGARRLRGVLLRRGGRRRGVGDGGRGGGGIGDGEVPTAEGDAPPGPGRGEAPTSDGRGLLVIASAGLARGAVSPAGAAGVDPALSHPALHVDQPVDQGVDGLRRADADQPGHGHLQHQPGPRRPGDLIVHVQHHLERAHEHVRLHSLGHLDEVRALVLRHVEEPLRGGAQPHQGRVAQHLQHLGGELGQVVAVAVHRLDGLQAAVGVALDEPLQHGVEQPPVHQPQRGRHLLGADLRHPVLALLPAEADHLVEQALGVPHRALARAGDHAQPGLGHLDLLCLTDAPQPLDHDAHRDALELEPLHPGQDRLRDPLRLGGREQEQHVRRRLLQRLEERVERPLRQHVDLVDDVDLLAAPHREVLHALPQLADVLDRVVARPVDLDDVLAASPQDLPAARALPARRRRRALLAVQRPRQRPRRGRLPHAPRAGEQERVVDPVQADRVLQGLRHMTLTGDLLKRRRPPLPGDRHIAHRPDLAPCSPRRPCCAAPLFLTTSATSSLVTACPSRLSVPSWSGPIVCSSLSLRGRDPSSVLPSPGGGPVLIADSPIGRLRGAISHAPRTPQGPGGRPRRSIRRVNRLTLSGLIRCASVCGVSPSGPPGSPVGRDKYAVGHSHQRLPLSDPASQLRFGWLEKTRRVRNRGHGHSRRRLSRRASRLPALACWPHRGARREPKASRGVPRGALPQTNHDDWRSAGVRRTTTAVLSARTLPWPGGRGGDGVVPRRMARRGKRKPRASGQPRPARGRPQRTHPPTESSPAGWRDGQRQDGSVGQPQPATEVRPGRIHPPPTESSPARWRGAQRQDGSAKSTSTCDAGPIAKDLPFPRWSRQDSEGPHRKRAL